jgi:hypothetical protein
MPSPQVSPATAYCPCLQVDVAAYVMDVELLFSSAAFTTVGEKGRA